VKLKDYKLLRADSDDAFEALLLTLADEGWVLKSLWCVVLNGKIIYRVLMERDA
jgi:hypothetical protein